MSQKKELLDKIARLQEDERKRRAVHKRETPYDPVKMNCERMPWGCWILVAVLLWTAFAIIMSIFQHHK